MEYRVDGIETTIPFFNFLMDHADFQAARFDTGFIDRLVPEMNLEHRSAGDGANVLADEHVAAAITAAAIFAFEESQLVKLPEESDSLWRRAGRGDAVNRGAR
jgi:acetyl/propionyl-CoA carboxylase alpha subunit